jgi:hypothetical protein
MRREAEDVVEEQMVKHGQVWILELPRVRNFFSSKILLT